jgi:hypothetical protein
MNQSSASNPLGALTLDNVWYLQVLSEMHARYGFRPLEPDMGEDAISHARKIYKKTDPIDPNEFPRRFWLDPERGGARGKILPPAHDVADYLVVSREFRDVLEQFDTGKYLSFGVTLLKHDKITPCDGEWFLVWIGNRKAGFIRQLSDHFNVPPYEDTKWLSIPRYDAVDGDFVMDASVKVGPDIWKDPTLSSSLLMSDRLTTALREAGLLKRLKVLRCPVAE